MSDGKGDFNEEDTNLILSALEANKRGSVGKTAGWFAGAMAGLRATGLAVQTGSKFVPGVTPQSAVVRYGGLGLGMGMSYLGGKFGGEIGDAIATADLNAQQLQNDLKKISYQFTSDPDSEVYQNERIRDIMAKAALERYKNNIPMNPIQDGNIGGELQNQKNEEVESKVKSGYYRNKPNRDRDVSMNNINNITNNTRNEYGKSSFHNPDGTARILDVKYS